MKCLNLKTITAYRPLSDKVTLNISPSMFLSLCVLHSFISDSKYKTTLNNLTLSISSYWMLEEQPYILKKNYILAHTNTLRLLLKLTDLCVFGRKKRRDTHSNLWLLKRWSELPAVPFWHEEQAQKVKDHWQALACQLSCKIQDRPAFGKKSTCPHEVIPHRYFILYFWDSQVNSENTSKVNFKCHKNFILKQRIFQLM